MPWNEAFFGSLSDFVNISIESIPFFTECDAKKCWLNFSVVVREVSWPARGAGLSFCTLCSRKPAWTARPQWPVPARSRATSTRFLPLRRWAPEGTAHFRPDSISERKAQIIFLCKYCQCWSNPKAVYLGAVTPLCTMNCAKRSQF